MSKKTFVIVSIIECLLLLGCLLDMPYGYYSFIRFVSMCVFAYFAIMFSSEKKKLCYFFTAMALLFQPFFKVTLGRTLWNIVDIVVAIILVVIVFNYKAEKDHDSE